MNVEPYVQVEGRGPSTIENQEAIIRIVSNLLLCEVLCLLKFSMAHI